MSSRGPSASDLDDDPEILPRVARRVRRPRAASLDSPIRAGEGAGLLGKSRSRQDHVGVERRFGDEEILHHEVIEHGEPFARMLKVGV